MQTATVQSDAAETQATPELAKFIDELFSSAALPETATLVDLRHILLGSDVFLSPDAELVYRLDRTAIVIAVDELIDRRGDGTLLKHLLES